MRWVIRSRSSSSAASISGVASSGQYKIPGTFRHGKIRLIIRVGRSASSSPLICRTLALALHPFASGQPFRAKYLDQALEYITGHPGVWLTTSDEIAAHFARVRPQAQQGQ